MAEMARVKVMPKLNDSQTLQHLSHTHPNTKY